MFGWGAIGVDIFFIISGFVITLTVKSMSSGVSSSMSFLRKRIARILPTYFIILFITFLVSGAMSTFHYHDKTQNLISALLFMPIDKYHAPFYVDDSGMYGIRWTLNYEVLFYLTISICLLTKHRWLLLSGILSLSLLIIPYFSGLSPSLSIKGYQFNSAYLNFITNPIIWTFYLGVIIGIIYPYAERWNKKLRVILLSIGVVLSTYCICYTPLVNHGITMSGWYLSVLFIGIILNEDTIKAYTPKLFITLGDISFSLYLIHTLMNGGIGDKFIKIGINDGTPRFIASCITSILLAYLSHRFIERVKKTPHHNKESLS